MKYEVTVKAGKRQVLPTTAGQYGDNEGEEENYQSYLLPLSFLVLFSLLSVCLIFQLGNFSPFLYTRITWASPMDQFLGAALGNRLLEW